MLFYKLRHVGMLFPKNAIIRLVYHSIIHSIED